MTKFFDIFSVWVVWASEKEWKLWNEILKHLQIFPWNKYWVNPKWWSFAWVLFYKSITSLPEIVDVLIFVTPANVIEESLLEVAKKWIKRVIIISAGFNDEGNIELEEKIKNIAEKNDILLLWPNCLGYTNHYENLNLSFWSKEIVPWNISVISQSWAIAVAITDWAFEKKLGFSKIVTLWNKTCLDEVDILNELKDDKNTKVVAIYLENIKRLDLFLNIAKKSGKKIIIMKAGVSKLWKKAIENHTGTILQDEENLIHTLKKAWLYVVSTLEDFFSLTELFSKIDLENIPKELAIITNAWWIWVLATDSIEKYGVVLTEFSKDEKEILKKDLPIFSVSNPIDILWDATSKSYKQILENIKSLQKKRAYLILLSPQSVTDVVNIAEVIVKFKNENPQYFIFTSFVGWKSVREWINILEKNGILNYFEPEKAVKKFAEILWNQS